MIRLAMLGVGAAATTVVGQGPVLAGLQPEATVAFEFVADTDGDGVAELVLVTVDGQVERHTLRRDGERSVFAATGVLRLRDPAHSLVACCDIAPAPGLELVVADRSGTVWLPWPDADDSPPPRSLARLARFTLRVDRPQASPFVQDLDRDGRLDLLLPTLQGCTPYLQVAVAGGGEPQFRALSPLPLPVDVTLAASNGAFDDEHQAGVTIPQVETADLNGDGRPDLVTVEGDKQAFHLQRPEGGFAAPIEVDVAQFRDSTPGAAVAPGATLVLDTPPMLQRGDIDGDRIPDFVIAHRRKVWTFRASTEGPQFTKARTQAVADDVSAMLVVDLDEDQRADLLTFQLQVPGVASLLLGLVQSIDVDIKAVGYRSEDGAFASLPAWRRTITLRVPPLLSLLSRQDELVQRFLGILGKARHSVGGAFVSDTVRDLVVVSADAEQLELFADAAAPTLGSATGRRMLRTLLFEDPNPVFDLERVFALVSGLLDQHAVSLTGARKVVATIPLRDATTWRVQRLIAANLSDARGDEVVVVYEAATAPARRAYDVLSFAAHVGR